MNELITTIKAVPFWTPSVAPQPWLPGLPTGNEKLTAL
jgi:hypothetical protein